MTYTSHVYYDTCVYYKQHQVIVVCGICHVFKIFVDYLISRKTIAMTKTIDPRIIKTKRSIHDAFSSLLAEKDLDEITIKELAETAEINRKTFYNHYSGIHQLVDEIENSLIERFSEALNRSDLSSDLNNPLALSDQLARIFSDEVNLRAHFKKFGFNTSLVQKIVDALKISLMSVFSRKLELDKSILKIAIEYWAAGFVAVFELWYKDGSRESVAKINRTVSILSCSGLHGLLEAQS